MLLSALLPLAAAHAQDNVLVYGNSIVFSPTVPYFRDLVQQTGASPPNVVTYILADQTTTHYVSHIGLITTSLPAGQTWRAMIVEGGTIENVPGLGNPTAFQNNMLTLANAFFTHSPAGLFICHETGADHPSSANYPSVAPNPATWLAYSHNAYVTAATTISGAHSTNPRPRIAAQGTCYAATAGYPTFLYSPDFHHPSTQGRVLIAMLWYLAIYGGRIENIAVNFTSSTPLVTRLIADNIDEAQWLRLVGLADASQPKTSRPYPGSDGDFQLRASIDSTVTNLVTHKSAITGSTLRVEPFSPLGTTFNTPAYVYGQFVTSGQTPNGGVPPGFWLDPNNLWGMLRVTNLSGGPFAFTIAPGLIGQTLWLQAVSLGTGPTYSDAQLVEIH